MLLVDVAGDGRAVGLHDVRQRPSGGCRLHRVVVVALGDGSQPDPDRRLSGAELLHLISEHRLLGVGATVPPHRELNGLVGFTTAGARGQGETGHKGRQAGARGSGGGHGSPSEGDRRERYELRHSPHLAHLYRSRGADALLFIDLDRFKPVNDMLGHHAGDLVARLGGDEFALFLPRSDQPEAMADRALESLSLPYSIEGDLVQIGASIGVASAPADGQDAVALLRVADAGLYEAKHAGRGQVRAAGIAP